MARLCIIIPHYTEAKFIKIYLTIFNYWTQVLIEICKNKTRDIGIFWRSDYGYTDL